MTHDDVTKPLKQFRPQHGFFVGVDSDGCVFDTMGIKHRECFCPWMIAYFDLQPVAMAARQCKEFADLFSKTRGENRHKTMARILTELLPNHPMVQARGFSVPPCKHYCTWAQDPNSLLSNEGLQRAIKETTDQQAKDELSRVLAWSKKVNESIAAIVKGIPPFKFVRESLEKIQEEADVCVVSATPQEAIRREWEEHDIAQYTQLMAGQEMGTKAEQLDHASGGKYKRDRVLMIGDAPGDMKAARANHALFYPINPDDEEASWQRFYEEALTKFIAGDYAGDYEERMLREFDRRLLGAPSWR